MKQEISAIIDQLKANGRWSDAASRIELYWMNGWVQYSSPQCGINFSSADTLAKWLTHNPIEDNHSEEVKTPDEQAFMASMDASSQHGFRPDQKEFKIYYKEINQVSSWDNYHYEVTSHGVTETWMDFFEWDAPPKQQIKHFSFHEYLQEGTNYGMKKYLEVEGLVSVNPPNGKSNVVITYSADLSQADNLLMEVFEKTIYKLARKKPPPNYWNNLRQHYREGSRHYHNLVHIANVYNTLLPFRKNVSDWIILTIAVFYHDVVYDPLKKDNEEESARTAREVLTRLKTSPNRIAKCVNHILATKYHERTKDYDTNLLIDADLSILGSPSAVYKKYTEDIRKEYNVYSDAEFYTGRKAALEKFLQREAIYWTSEFKDLETKARANLNNEILEITLNSSQYAN